MSYHQNKVVTLQQYHKINIDRLGDGLGASAFVACPSNDNDTLYKQYLSSLSDLLDIHAPMKMRFLTKPAPGWITNEFRTTKCLRRQYECTLRTDKSTANCAQTANKQMSAFTEQEPGTKQPELSEEKSGDSKKLWHVLSKVLSRSKVSTHHTCTD